MEIELKPCPFCGSKADLNVTIYTTAGNGMIHIECEQCPSEMREYFIVDTYIRKNSIDGQLKVQNKLIDKWNNRKGH
jgi:sarcosine oxidase delta subunit